MFSEVISVQPDLTQTVVTIQNHNALDTPNNNHLGSMEKVPVYSDIEPRKPSALFLEQPNLPMKNNTSNDYLAREDSKSSLKSMECESRPPSIISCHLPNNIDHEALVWATVNHTGGRIAVPDAGKCLFVD